MVRKFSTLIGYLCGLSLSAMASQTVLSDVKLLQACQDLPHSADALSDAAEVTRRWQEQRYLAEALSWVKDPTRTACGGYFKSRRTPASTWPSLLGKSTPIQINAERTSLLSRTNASVLRGQVVVSELGQRLEADNACIFRNPQDKSLSKMSLLGSVHLTNADGELRALKASMTLDDHTIDLDDVIYRLAPYEVSKRMKTCQVHRHRRGGYTSLRCPDAKSPPLMWGTAKHAQRKSDKTLHLRSATFSTCSPLSPVWQISSSHLSLDKAAGWGQSTNTVLWLQHVPIFYFPWFSFPLDGRRKTGFLYPYFAYSSKDGMHVSLPFYWNIAPNADWTVIQQVYSERGVGFDNTWRFLWPHSRIEMEMDIIPHDNAFARFRERSLGAYANVTGAGPSLARLRKDTRWRGYGALHFQTQMGNQWQSHLDLEGVTDDYYLTDFRRSDDESQQAHLPSEFTLDYNGPVWQWHNRLLTSQTLHPVNQSAVKDLYFELPRTQVAGQLSQLGFDSKVQIEGVNFVHRRDFATGVPIVAGQRLSFDPTVSYPLRGDFAYLTPRFEWHVSHYQLRDQAEGVPVHMDRSVPVYSLDSGLYFDRTMSWNQHFFRQSLEPRLFYLYVPRRSQANYPLFDTALKDFKYDELFKSNRFSGGDRVGDANQLSFGLVSRFYQQKTGMERLRLSAGAMYAFRKHQVCGDDAACERDINRLYHLSPVAFAMRYYGDRRWEMNGDYARDISRNHSDQAGVNLAYKPEPGHKVYLDYYLGRNQDVGLGISSSVIDQDVHRVGAGFSWNLTSTWAAASAVHYNLAQSYATNYSAGLAYQSCCWTLRLVAKRYYDGVDAGSRKQYDTKYLMQFELKGLGGVGHGDVIRLFD